MKVGLFFGSFNPVHIGHLILADAVLDRARLDEVWLVVSPQNPFKNKKSLLHEQDRYDLLVQAIGDNDRLRASDVEFRLPRPSYTIDTLDALQKKHPKHQFSVIMGGDNLTHFEKWKDYERILTHYGILVFPRPGAVPPQDLVHHPAISLVDTPLLEVSAAFIRTCLREGRSVRYLLPDAVLATILRKGFYT